MKLSLESKIQYLTGVGPKIGAKLNRLGIETLHDLLFNFPRKYLDYTVVTKIGDLAIKMRDKDNFTIRGQIIGIANKKTRRRGFTVTETVVADDSGSLKVVWFNQPYLVKMLRAGSMVILNGKVSFDSFSNGLVMESPMRANSPRIVPVYGETEGLSSFYLAKLVSSIRDQVASIEEWLPETLLCHSRAPLSSSTRSSSLPSISTQALSLSNGSDEVVRPQSRMTGSEDDNSLNLLPIQDAILNIHQPKNAEMLARAQRRLAFDELFMISLRANLTRLESRKYKAESIKTDIPKLKEFIAGLPFELTGDQKKALWQILKDMGADVPMSRLLNGDVGSGKTIVAALAAFIASANEFTTIIMAPTEILANQHYQTLLGLFPAEKVGIFTSSNKNILKLARIIVGTHALIQKGVEFKNIGLVVVDEQHRFGVGQRQSLMELGKDGDFRPHFLSMTATPIPRTLHLALFGDLDISVIREKPADRKEIKTRFVEPENREKAYEFVRNQISAGRQAFVICPLIEESQAESGKRKAESLFEEERKSVKAEFEKLKKIFPEFKIEMLHGKMKSKDKDEVMAKFSSDKADILVSTSVVEVGVDIPNASVMVIEDAERFGLAQIHQFRGRVGRGEYQSYCFLFSNSRSEKALSRLASLEETSDGFKLAEIDLETRGPGAVFGTEQSGMLDLKMASLSDRMLIEEASRAAKEIAPEIDNYPKLMEKLVDFASSRHLE